MKQAKWISVFIATVMMSVIVGCASSPNKESTGQYIDDSVITTKVKAAIVQDPELKVFEINVETYKGRVQLSGFVGTEERIAKALEITRTVEGVRSVKNDMRLK